MMAADILPIKPMHIWPGAGGIRLAGDSWGDIGRPVVVLLHGGGQTRHAWNGAGEKLAAAGYNAIAFDARGHGESDWAPDGLYSADVMVQDLKCVISALGAVSPILIGASMGGNTSLLAVGERHVQASALVLVDVAPRIEKRGAEKVLAFMKRNPNGFATIEEVADAISAYQPHRSRPRNLNGLVKNVRLGQDGRYRWHWDPRFLSQSFDLQERQLRLEASTRNLVEPTLLIRGSSSDVLTDIGVREFLTLCPHAEFVEISGAGHMIAGDRNDVFANAIVSFLSRAVPIDAGSVVQLNGWPFQ